ncbi:conjugal transfer protein TraF [Rickettsia sp. TH2014]|uniref:conjugal transfer protein TraF n=1 Tax=Rickettsia sp. TH2014 TaxID=1967503 RepID=UPI001C451C74|nr:conjugal transfer protein TraF [Rickettsia sp. TH2014]
MKNLFKFLLVSSIKYLMMCSLYLMSIAVFAEDLRQSNAAEIEQARAKYNKHDWQENPEGFLWYNEQAQSENLKKPTTIIQKQNLNNDKTSELTPRLDRLKKNFDIALKVAIDNPSYENVTNAQRLQNEIFVKSQEFAKIWQLVSLLDPSLSSTDTPSNVLQKRIYDEEKKITNQQQLREISKNWGLIMQVSFNCKYCKTFAPIVKDFAAKHSFQVIAASNSGNSFEGIGGIKSGPFLNQLNSAMEVPVLYLVSRDSKYVYPVARSIINEDEIAHNILAIHSYHMQAQSASNIHKT